MPLGVVGVIYENRPNVTSDAAALCLKAGQRRLPARLVGRPGVEPGHRRRSCAGPWPRPACPRTPWCSSRTPRTRRRSSSCGCAGSSTAWCRAAGATSIAALLEHATVPYVLDGDGNCHVYVDAAADLAMAEEIVVNAKTQRPGVCNAAESLLVHRDVAARVPAPGGAGPRRGRAGGRRARPRGPARARRRPPRRTSPPSSWRSSWPSASSTTSTGPSRTSTATARATPRPS